MDKVLIDVEVIKGILNSYQRADKNQSRIYGIILGNQKDNIFHITDAIYGYIFESGEDEKTHKKNFTRINDENIKSLLNSYHQNFNSSQNNLNKSSLVTSKNKEKENAFKRNDTQMILGGFATDKELFKDLINLYSTIELISNNVFKNINSIILLVDPNHKNEKEIQYGIKTYNWSIKSIKIQKNEYNKLLFFKELDNEVIRHINNIDLLNNITNKSLWDKIYNLKLEKNDKRNINELLLIDKDKDKEDDIFVEENNVDYIKNKIKESILYLNIFEKILENNEESNKDCASIVNEEDFNQISFILSELEPMLNNKEIIEVINNDIDSKCNINSLTQLLEVQLALSDKVRDLLK